MRAAATSPGPPSAPARSRCARSARRMRRRRRRTPRPSSMRGRGRCTSRPASCTSPACRMATTSPRWPCTMRFADAVSLGLVVDRISAAYADPHARAVPAGPVPSPSPGVGGDAAMSTDAAGTLDRVHWRAALAGSEAAGSLPLIRAAKDGDAATRGEVTARLDAAAFERLGRAAARAGVTRFEACLAAYLVVLARQTGREAACATFQSAGRRMQADREGVVGVFSCALRCWRGPIPKRPSRGTPARCAPPCAVRCTTSAAAPRDHARDGRAAPARHQLVPRRGDAPRRGAGHRGRPPRGMAVGIRSEPPRRAHRRRTAAGPVLSRRPCARLARARRPRTRSST